MYESREGSFVHVTPDGEHIEVVGVRVLNDNPRYPIRVNAVAFTPADQQTQPQLWFSEKWGLPMNIEPRDATPLISQSITSAKNGILWGRVSLAGLS